jgi:hypothetical protein
LPASKRDERELMELYTVIMELIGGTYISQVHAENELAALQIGAGELDHSQVKDMGEQIKKDIIEKLAMKDEYDQPIALAGLINAWCTYLSIKGRRMLINIVRTKE